MKRKITGLILCFMFLCMSLLTGCSLVETNYDKYYNQIVAVVENNETGEKAEITKRELIQSYQNYGYSYVQNGYSQQEALKMTVERLENRKIVFLTAREKFNVGENEEGLSEKEQTYLYQKTMETLKDNLNSYYADLSSSNESQPLNDSVKFNAYKKNAQLQIDSTYEIVKVNETEDLMEGFTYEYAKNIYNEADFDEIYVSLKEMLSNDNYKKAYSRYLRDLKLSEFGQNLTSREKDVFGREIKRIYDVLFENYLISKYSNSNKNMNGLSNVSADEIVNLYASKVRASYTQYVIEQDSNYSTDVQKNLNNVYYFTNGTDSTKYFTVANILFKFTDAQQKQYNTLKAKFEANDGGYSYVEYEQDLNDLYASIKPVVRQFSSETGSYEEVESDLTINDIYTSLNNSLNFAKAEGINAVGDLVNEYIYKYNQDPGMFNAENNYVIGVDKDGKAVSNFVEAFNTAGLALYDGGRGEIGDISTLVRTEYGLHLIIYTGACDNLFNGINSSFTLGTADIEKLNSTRVNLLVDKTYFDVLYDEIYTDNYTAYENSNMVVLRNGYSITEFSGRYLDLINQK